MNRMIVMFVALFVGVSGSAFLMMQGSKPPGPARAVSSVQTTGNSPSKDEDGKISAVESKATVGEEKSATAGPKFKETSSARPSGDQGAKNSESESKRRRVTSSSQPSESSTRTSSSKNKRVNKRQMTTVKAPEPDTTDSRWDEDLDKLQGTWQAVDAIHNGEGNRDVAKHYSWDFTGNKYTINSDGNFQELWSVRLDSGRTPGTIDGTSVSPVTGKKLMGIYEIKGDTLKVCYNLSGQGRPTSFDGAKGTGCVLYILQRR